MLGSPCGTELRDDVAHGEGGFGNPVQRLSRVRASSIRSDAARFINSSWILAARL
jgi:hypothetical protein